MAINSATDLSRLQRDNEAPVAARSGFDPGSLRTRDFARMLQEQAAERAATERAVTERSVTERAAEGRPDGASARSSADPGDANPVSPPKLQTPNPSAGLRLDVEQRNAAVRQAQQGMQEANRERADLATRRAEAARADTANAASSSAAPGAAVTHAAASNPAARKPATAQTGAATAVTDPSADAEQAAHEAPATMAGWLRHAARASRAGRDPAAGEGAAPSASDDVPRRSEDGVTVAALSGPASATGLAALDPAAALAAGGAWGAYFAGAAAKPATQGSQSGADSPGAVSGKGRNEANQPALDDGGLPAGAQTARSALQGSPASLDTGPDGAALSAAAGLGGAEVERRARSGAEVGAGGRTSDFAPVSAAPAWDTRLALDGVQSSDAVAAAVPISTPVQDEGFGEHVGLTVGTLTRQGIESATLQLNPAEMGPVAVSIALAGDQARVNFTADREDTRKALEASLTQLDAAFRADGLVLVEAQVAPTAPAPDAGGADTGTASGQGYPQGGASNGGRSGADPGSGEPRNRWAAAGIGPAARTWDLRVHAADGSILASSPRPNGTGQLDLYA